MSVRQFLAILTDFKWYFIGDDYFSYLHSLSPKGSSHTGRVAIQICKSFTYRITCFGLKCNIFINIVLL